jgi:hypothetical protein
MIIYKSTSFRLGLISIFLNNKNKKMGLKRIWIRDIEFRNS